MKKLLSALMIAVMTMGTAAVSYAMPAPVQTTQHLKKDGTPDMRYKENKNAKTGKTTPAAASTTAPAAKMKKDGTPDMRSKSNKTAAPAATSPATATPAGKMKKDGTPDMRTKSNKMAAPKKS